MHLHDYAFMIGMGFHFLTRQSIRRAEEEGKLEID
jgi:hypothetical protein